MSKPTRAAVAASVAVAVPAFPGVGTAAARPIAGKEVISPRTVLPLTIPGPGVKKGAAPTAGAAAHSARLWALVR